MQKQWIVVGDRTDHGGTVLTGSAETTALGRQIARVGDSVVCPRCRKTTRIVTGDPDLVVDGSPVARHGDATDCGAKLISMQQQGVTAAAG